MFKSIISIILLVFFLGFIYLLLSNKITMEDLWQSAVEYVSHTYEDLDNKQQPERAQNAQFPEEIVEPITPLTAPNIPRRSIDHNNNTQTQQDQPLPKLIESDTTLQNELNDLADHKQLWQFLRLDALIQRFVITVDNLAKDKIPYKYLLVKPPPGKFAVRKNKSDQEYISVKNDTRYEDFVKLVESIDLKELLAVYQQYYPLFQEAYEDIGYKNAQFNDRLLDVIDHLLQTPDVKGSVKLTHLSVFYKFADPHLQALSAGQKILVRMGSDNAKRLKAKLRELELELSTLLLKNI